MLSPDVAVFTYTEHTQLVHGDGVATSVERETIIFQRFAGR